MKRLLLALEEKRQYAHNLESKVTQLKQKMKSITAQEGDKHLQLAQLNKALQEQVEEYGSLAEQYQALFAEHERLEREFLNAAVHFETKLHLLNLKGEEAQNEALLQAEAEKRHLKAETERLTLLLEQYKKKYQLILKSFSGWTPEMILGFQEQVKRFGIGARLPQSEERT
jgi:chromosome segregation ATPase